MGTYNGLLFLSDDLHTESDRLCLWNLCVRKLVNLPSPNVTYITNGGFGTIIGFEFDSKTNDYKVVRVVLNVLSLVYSLSTGEWKMVRMVFHFVL